MNTKSDVNRRLTLYGLAVVAAGVALLLRLPLAGYLGPRVAYITFLPAVMLTAILGGIGPGLLATALSALLSALWILPPHGRLWPMDLPDAASLGFFLSIGVFMCIMSGLYHGTRRRAAACERELAVRDSEQRLGQAYDLLEGISEGTEDLIAALDTDFRYIHLNRAYQDDFRRIYGTEIQVGSSMLGALAHLPEDQQRALAFWGRALQGEAFTVTEEFGDPGRQRNVYELRYSPMRDAKGRLVGAAHIVRDVTARVQAEKALRRSEALYRAIACNLPDGGVWVVDRDLRYLVAEGGMVAGLGLDREALEGRTLAEVHEAATRVWAERRFRRALGGRGGSYETGYGGRVFWSQFVPLRDESGGVVAAMALSQDITERKRTEENLRAALEAAEEASRAKSEFLANMSHELRTPMTVIMSSLEFLRHAGPAGEQRQLLEMADASAHRLLGIIDDLLDISRIEARQLKIEAKTFDLRDCVREAAEMFAAPARDKGLRLSWQVAPQVPSLVRGDPDRIGQVLANLVGNAVKFTEAGEVAVNIDDCEDGVVFTVRDTGIGIPPGKMGMLFQPFTQVDGSLTRRYGGTGLGLAISRELVELMGGTIGAQSEEGQGSTFTFTLPLRPEPLADRPPRPKAPAARGRTVRVLLAEDDPSVLDLMQMVLRQRGWEVATSENGRQAVARWEEGGFDLVLMDLQMPELDGLAATRMIRAREAGGSHTPIIALTAHARPEDRDACRAAGMDGFLTKPIRMDEFDAVIQSCLARNSPSRLPPAS